MTSELNSLFEKFYLGSGDECWDSKICTFSPASMAWWLRVDP